LKTGTNRLLAAPYIVWMAIFIIVPLLIVIYYSFTTIDGGFSLANYEKFFDPIYLGVLWRSLKIAFFCTLGCLLIGYPLALILTTSDFVKKKYLMFLCILPMWMNMLLRTYAWMTLLEKKGIINIFLGWFGVDPIQMLYTSGAVYLGLIYNFLPFMILPIYSVMVKMDHGLIEAAEDLGANRFQVFRKIILPKSMPGVITGITMVFMPAVTTFVISRLLGGGQYTLIGNLIEKQFVESGNWYFGSAISILMMVLILISMYIMKLTGSKDDVGGGMF
jgi:spermidine/putrescine transport system permease protein